MNEDRTLSYDAWPFYWLTRAHGRYQDALASALAGTDMDPTSWRVVMILKEDDWLTVSEMAAQANAKLSTMTKMIKRMEAGGLVELREGMQDRRATEVRLTPAGKGLVATAVKTARHVFDRAFSGFDTAKLELLRTLLSEMAESLR